MLVTSEMGRLWGTGVAVAVEAPAHAQRRHQGHGFHLVDAAMAGDAADAGRHVCAVVEIGVVGQLVDPNPAHRPAAVSAFPNGREQRAVLLHQRMAVHHARARGWQVRDRRHLDRSVTVTAIETQFADVELVAGRDRLNGTVAHVCVPRKKNNQTPAIASVGPTLPAMAATIGSLFHQAGGSGPTARTPGRCRTVAPAESPRWNVDAASAQPQKEFAGGNDSKILVD